MKKWLVLIFLIWISYSVAAADFIPQGNIDGKDRYNITGIPVINGTLFIGDGSQLTGIGNNTDNRSWNQSHADTLYAGIGAGNASWNETYAQGVFAKYSFEANNFNGSGNINTTGEINGVNQTMFNALISNFNSWITNAVSDLQNYYSKTVINSLVTGNRTESEAALRTDIESNRSYLEDLKLNITDQRFNETDEIAAINTSQNIDNLGAVLNSELPLENQTIVNWQNITERPSGLDDGDDDTTYTAGANISLIGGAFSVNGTSLKIWLDTLYEVVGSYLTNDNFQTAFDANFSDKDTDDLSVGSTNRFDNQSWNESKADAKYAGIALVGDNESFNKSYTDSLYDPLGSANLSFNKTFTDQVYATVDDNESWNESHADSKYADISVVTDNETWSEARADTLYADISVTGDNASFNKSFTDNLYSTVDGNLSWNESKADGKYAAIGAGSDNSSWNESHADSKYILQSSEGDLNANNSDFWDNYDEANTSQFNSAGILTLSEDFIGNLFDTFFVGLTADDLAAGATNKYDNLSWNQSHGEAIFAPISTTTNNNSWNQSHADTLYDGDATDEVLIDGSRALTGNWAVGGFNITNIGRLFVGAVAYPSNFAGNFKGGINVTENSVFEKNLTHLNNTYTCYGSACESYIGHNGSGLVIKF